MKTIMKIILMCAVLIMPIFLTGCIFGDPDDKGACISYDNGTSCRYTTRSQCDDKYFDTGNESFREGKSCSEVMFSFGG